MKSFSDHKAANAFQHCKESHDVHRPSSFAMDFSIVQGSSQFIFSFIILFYWSISWFMVWLLATLPRGYILALLSKLQVSHSATIPTHHLIDLKVDPPLPDLGPRILSLLFQPFSNVETGFNVVSTGVKSTAPTQPPIRSIADLYVSLTASELTLPSTVSLAFPQPASFLPIQSSPSQLRTQKGLLPRYIPRPPWWFAAQLPGMLLLPSSSSANP